MILSGNKNFIIFSTTAAFLSAPFIVLAQTSDTLGLRFAEALGLEGGGGPHQIITGIVDYLLSFTAIVSVVVIMWGGLKFMVSFGKEERLASARKTIISGIIGLIIVLCSYAIVELLIRMVSDLL